MISALLTATFFWCLFYGQVPSLFLGCACVLSGIVFGILSRHQHSSMLSVDLFAQTSRLNAVNPFLKTWSCLALLLLCVSTGIMVGLFLAVVTLSLSVFAGKLHLRDYLTLLVLPANFLLLGGLALLFEWTREPSGILNIGILGGWLSVSAAAQTRALLVLARSFGAVSALYLLSLSTPLSEIIHVLRRARVPAVITDLMYLIYRCLFILMELYGTMRDAAESRLGFQNFSHSLHTAGCIYANLLGRSFQNANASYDAMESRCYDGEICFLTQVKPLTRRDVAVTAVVFCFAAALSIWENTL